MELIYVFVLLSTILILVGIIIRGEIFVKNIKKLAYVILNIYIKTKKIRFKIMENDINAISDKKQVKNLLHRRQILVLKSMLQLLFLIGVFHYSKCFDVEQESLVWSIFSILSSLLWSF